MSKGRIFSGVQPTGNLHLGNYLGAIRNFVPLQDDYECIYCVVDMHAITLWQDPAELKAQTREVASAYLAAGKLKYRAHKLQGLESAIEGINLLFTGGNTGKLMVEL